MGLLQDKLSKFRLPQLYMERGVYPYFREIDSHQDTEVIMDGKKVLMFGSNSYMGLTYDERIIEAAVAATRKYGTGCAGSRFLNGTLDLHVQLEKELAEFVGKDDALVYSTGFTVNEGVVSCLTDRNDYIICDDRDHASIVDGRRLSFSTQLKYKHNDMEALEKELQKCKPESVKLIVVDGVFSMEGDLANLPEIVRLKDKYNASIMVDEAHNFKNLAIFSKMNNVSGISSSGAKKSTDMQLKCQYLSEINDGRGIVFATGTPISNTMCEMYVMQLYLQKPVMIQVFMPEEKDLRL